MTFLHQPTVRARPPEKIRNAIECHRAHISGVQWEESKSRQGLSRSQGSRGLGWDTWSVFWWYFSDLVPPQWALQANVCLPHRSLRASFATLPTAGSVTLEGEPVECALHPLPALPPAPQGPLCSLYPTLCLLSPLPSLSLHTYSSYSLYSDTPSRARSTCKWPPTLTDTVIHTPYKHMHTHPLMDICHAHNLAFTLIYIHSTVSGGQTLNPPPFSETWPYYGASAGLELAM